MRRIQVLIREVDDEQPDQSRDLATFDLPATDVAALQPETALDQLEATTHAVGTAILRRTLEAQWDVVDATLAEQYRQGFSPSAPQRRRTRRRTSG
jgi:hypothetical protein